MALVPRKIEISYKTIIFTTLFLIFLWFLYYIRDIILLFFVALLITTILDPLISKLSKYRIPRALSTLVVYFVFIGTVIEVVSSIVPPLLEQTTSFANSLPRYISNLGIAPVLSDQIGRELLSVISLLPSQAVKVTLSLFSNILNIITVLILTFYLLLSHHKTSDQLKLYLGETRALKISKLVDKVEKILGSWARGELILMTLVGLANFIGLILLGIPFALPLAILAGLLEIVPYIGPITAAIPSVLIGFGISPILGMAALALAFLVQQLENYVFVPKVMERSVGVSPIVTILALTIGFRLAGVVGVLISVPVVLFLQVIFKEYSPSDKALL